MEERYCPYILHRDIWYINITNASREIYIYICLLGIEGG